MKSSLPFHGAGHVGDMAQAVHYFLQHGLEYNPQINGVLTAMDKFILFFACVVSHFDSPGLTNDFLIKVRHPRAIRYNDNAVNENHNVSLVFRHLQDPELNFLIHLDKERLDFLF